MKKILIFTPTNDGVSYHRLITPFKKLQEQYPEEFQIKFLNKDTTRQECFELSKKYNFLIFNRLFPVDLIDEIKKNGCKVICDVDDYWELGINHPLYTTYKLNNTGNKIKDSIIHSDYITTTTEYLANKIKNINPNVTIFPNAVVFKSYHIDNQKVRFGIIGSSSHTEDMNLLVGIANQLDSETLSKIQFVLCGFDKGETIYYDNDGKQNRVQTPWEDVCWVKWEKSFTDDYRTLSPEYADFLKKYLEVDYKEENEPYKRIWTKDTNTYNFMFDEIDCLLIPLIDNEFNRCKSPLKLAEAASKEVGVLCSDVLPYSPYLNEYQRINVRKGVRGFVQGIKRYLKSEDRSVYIPSKELFKIENITEERKKWFDSI